jgi:hypothetical protein
MAAVVLPFLVTDMAVAQQQQAPDPNVTVRGRDRPEYDPLGIRAGSFLVFPELSVTESYSDNVGFDENDTQSDFITQIEPSVRFVSDWSRHQLGLEVGSDIAFHVDENDEDYQDFFAVGSGKLDVSRQTALSAEVEARQAHESRADPEDEDDNELTDFYQYGGALSASHQFNRLILTLTGAAERDEFKDDEDEDRDSWVYDALLRSAYEVSPRFNMFVEGRYNIEDRDENVDSHGIERDTNGYEGRVGAGLDVTAVLFGEAFVGYRVQQFEEDGFDDEKGVSLGLDLNWNPTTLTSVGFSGKRDFVPTTQANAASNLRTEFGVTIDHELMRSVIVGATAQYKNDDFRGDDRNDDIYAVGAGLTYWMNRNLSFNAGYDYSTRNSNVDGEDFDVNQFLIGLTARL